MTPEWVDYPDEDKYVYAKCMCPVPITYAIKIPRVDGQDSYHFKCEICGCEGDVLTKGSFWWLTGEE